MKRNRTILSKLQGAYNLIEPCALSVSASSIEDVEFLQALVLEDHPGCDLQNVDSHLQARVYGVYGVHGASAFISAQQKK